MANTLVQFRIDEMARKESAQICEELGIDLPTYMRMCVARLIHERGIPFPMNLSAARALSAIREAHAISEANGTSGMTLEDVNAEIADGRHARKS